MAKNNVSADACEMCINDSSTSDPTQIVEAFSKKFASLSLEQGESTPRNGYHLISIDQSNPFQANQLFNFQVVHPGQGCKLLRELPHKKATGCDLIPSKFLSLTADVIAGSLTSLINFFLQSNSIPPEWTRAKVIPGFKSGDKSNINNYRPISIFPVVSKILESIVNQQLSEFLNYNSFLHERQFSFRKGHSTEMLLLDTVDESLMQRKLWG